MMKKTIEVRGYELDRGGRIPSPTWLRWFEHQRWDATAGGAAIDLASLFDDGKRFVVRAQKLEILRGRLPHGEAVELSLWVSRVGRSSLDLSHSARRLRDGVEVARAAVVAVHLSADGVPTEVPAAMRALVEEGPSPRGALLTERRPAAAVEVPLVVRPSDIDLRQHVNHAVYAQYFEDARATVREAGGFGPRRQSSFPTRALAIDYAQEARLGDALSVFTWALPNEPAIFGFDLMRAGGDKPIARGRLEVSELETD